MASSVLSNRRVLVPLLIGILVLLGWYAWTLYTSQGPDEGFIVGNGRIEATEIDIATKLPGRVAEILVREGDFVTAGQVLAHMQVDTLRAQQEEAQAGFREAEYLAALLPLSLGLAALMLGEASPPTPGAAS